MVSECDFKQQLAIPPPNTHPDNCTFWDIYSFYQQHRSRFSLPKYRGLRQKNGDVKLMDISTALSNTFSIDLVVPTVYKIKFTFLSKKEGIPQDLTWPWNITLFKRKTINGPFSTVIIAPTTGNQQIIPHPHDPTEAAAPAISELGALPPMEVFFDGHCPERNDLLIGGLKYLLLNMACWTIPN